MAFSCSTETKSIDLDNLKSEIINNSKEFQLAYINNEYSNAKIFPSDNTRNPERMPWAQDELNSNLNAPDEGPGIFAKTEVNQ